MDLSAEFCILGDIEVGARVEECIQLRLQTSLLITASRILKHNKYFPEIINVLEFGAMQFVQKEMQSVQKESERSLSIFDKTPTA